MKDLSAESIMITLIILFLSQNVIWQSNEALEIRVSQSDGQDNRSCLERDENIKCISLELALQGLEKVFLRNDKELKILMEDSLYLLNQRVTILQPRLEIHISIEGSCRGCRAMTFQCVDPKAGITVGSQNAQGMAQNVLFRNLEFRSCGPTLASAVIIWNSINVSFFDCNFLNNIQAGINGMDSSVLIESCSFINNTCNMNVLNKTSETPMFVAGIISQSAGSGFIFTNSANLSVVIRDSNFYNNSAVVHSDLYYVSPGTNVSNFGEGGGAISVVFFNTTTNCMAVLDNLTLLRNSATYGGAIYTVESGTSSGNSFVFRRSVINNNFAGQAGGGICISQWDESRTSSILIDNCTLEGNSAPRGGGMNAFFMSAKGLLDSKMRIRQLIVRRNVAKSAPAIRFTSSLPYGEVPSSVIELIDCVISEHISSPHNMFSYLSPVTVQRLKVRVLGVNEIKHNRGAGGMVLEHGILLVEGILNFTNNTAPSGGGLRIWSGQIKLYPHSELIFVDNHVTTIGGALSVQLFPSYEVIHTYNKDCFLTYSDSFTPPSKWKTKVIFVRNSAKLKGAAIFVSTLMSCLWDEKPPHYSFNRSLRWIKSTFIYESNYMKIDNDVRRLYGSQYAIATDTAVLEADSCSPSVELFPGEYTKLSLKGRDELGHTVHTIANVLMSNDALQHSDDIMVPNTLNVLDSSTNNTLFFKYHALGSKAYQHMIGKSHKISVRGVYSTMNFDYSFNLKSVACSPGYMFHDKICICNKSIPGVLRCGGDRTLYLKEGFWAGLSSDGHLITYYCPFKYCQCTRERPDNGIPGCLLDTKNFTAQCAIGRMGFLCGQCAKGLSVGLRMYECLDCQHNGWILLVVFVIVVALCVLVIYLNPSISKDLRGPLFFFQMLPFIFKPADEVGAVVKVVAYVFEFGGPFVYFWKTCIFNGITNIYALAVGYMMPLTTLLIFLVAYILSTKGIIRTKLRKKSNLNSFWLIILFMYKYLVETTLLVLHCPIIDGKMRFFYDGNIECFHGKHIFMATAAIVVLVTLVIPPPVIIVLLTKGYWKVDPQYLSTLTDGLRDHCPWWWAVDFGRRILIVGTFVFIPKWETKEIWMIIMCLFVFAIHANVQPYKRICTNITESIYLFALCILTIVQIMDDQESRSGVTATILIIATIHASIICLIKFVWFCKKRCHCNCPNGAGFPHYGTFNDDSEKTESVDSTVRAKQNLFDSIFASSVENSNTDSNEVF